MIKYSTIKELRFLREDTYVMYYVGSSVGSFVVVVFLRVTLYSVFLLRLLCFFLFFFTVRHLYVVSFPSCTDFIKILFNTLTRSCCDSSRQYT